jgi:hypothetical protein
MIVQLERLMLRAAPLVNAPVAAMTRSPLFGKFVGRAFAIVTYTGQRSGRTVSLPVGYRRRGDDVEITVPMPHAKTWWRNFLGDGNPISLTLDGRDIAGHAVATLHQNGAVTVLVRLRQ